MVGVSLGHSGIMRGAEIVTPRVVAAVGSCRVRRWHRRLSSSTGPISNCDRVDSAHEAIRVQPETRPVVPKKFAGDQAAITSSREVASPLEWEGGLRVGGEEN